MESLEYPVDKTDYDITHTHTRVWCNAMMDLQP